jgi:molecular chaperone DnaK (HSP70)
MRHLAILVVIPMLGVFRASAQSISCESHKEGDAYVSTCTSDDRISVTRCDSSGCTSSSSAKEATWTTEQLRRHCDAEGLDSFCAKLIDRVEFERSHEFDIDCNGVIPMSRSVSPRTCEQRVETKAKEHKLNDEAIEKYRKKIRNRQNAQTLEACGKGVLDKRYCDEFNKKLAEEQSKDTASTPEQKNKDTASTPK